MQTKVKRLMTGAVMVGAAVGVYAAFGPSVEPGVQAGSKAACDSWCKPNCANLGYACYSCDANHCGCYVNGC